MLTLACVTATSFTTGASIRKGIYAKSDQKICKTEQGRSEQEAVQAMRESQLCKSVLNSPKNEYLEGFDDCAVRPMENVCILRWQAGLILKFEGDPHAYAFQRLFINVDV